VVPGRDRLQAVMQRIDGLHKNIGVRVNAGAYPAATGDALHRRLEVIRQEASDMASQHGGGISSDEQRLLGQELDMANRVIEQ
jgi:cell division septum initiation protein DivIVA